MKKTKKGFTLVEILVALAIVAVMAAVVMATMRNMGSNARSSKAQAMLSSAIPSMYSCWGNGGNVMRPSASGGNQICDLSTSYGYWPDFTSGTMTSYDFSNSGGSCGPTPCIAKTGWFISVASSNVNYDDRRICCNERLQGCASTIKPYATSCSATGWVD